jgi:hypothetical protein
MDHRDRLHSLVDNMPETIVAQVINFAEFIAQRAHDAQAEALKAHSGDRPKNDDLSEAP